MELWECLAKAADLIEEKGWGRAAFNQGSLSGGTAYNFCIIGACAAVCPVTSLSIFAKGLGFVANTNGGSAADAAYNWNDGWEEGNGGDCKTHKPAGKARVIKRLRTCSAKLKAEQAALQSAEQDGAGCTAP